MSRKTLPELEAYIRTIDTDAYARNRNYLGGSTELSEYITRGVISLPRVKELALENNDERASYKFINELAWREYWQSVWYVKGDAIFDYIRPLRQPARNGIPTAVLNATTGINALDEGIKQLQQTGYIHNHMRMWLAGLICNVARCDWKVGAAWMHSYLIDGDLASNHLSWQWVAGSYTGKPYLPQQDNINTYTKTGQKNTYLDQPYDAIADMPIPEQLQEITASLPVHDAQLPANTITSDELSNESEVLLYSPWTLDPSWHRGEAKTRILFLDTEFFKPGAFSQQVIDSIAWYANQIPELQIYTGTLDSFGKTFDTATRKSYPGISHWPGTVELPELLYPDVPKKFYPSFSSFWKQTQKTAYS